MLVRMCENFFANTLVVSLTVVLLKKYCVVLLYWGEPWPFIVNKYFFGDADQ